MNMLPNLSVIGDIWKHQGWMLSDSLSTSSPTIWIKSWKGMSFRLKAKSPLRGFHTASHVAIQINFLSKWHWFGHHHHISLNVAAQQPLPILKGALEGGSALWSSSLHGSKMMRKLQSSESFCHYGSIFEPERFNGFGFDPERSMVLLVGLSRGSHSNHMLPWIKFVTMPLYTKRGWAQVPLVHS